MRSDWVALGFSHYRISRAVKELRLAWVQRVPCSGESLDLHPTSGQKGPGLGSSFGVRVSKITKSFVDMRVLSVVNCPFGETFKAAAKSFPANSCCILGSPSSNIFPH